MGDGDQSINSYAPAVDFDPLNNSFNNEVDEALDYDPLGESIENTEAEKDSKDNESDSDDSIIELETEPCPLCHDNFSSKSDLIKHLAFCHFQAGLLKELLDLGWEEGGRVCPKCQDFVDQHMLLHWADHHERAQMFLRMFKQKEVKIEIKKDKKYCHNFIHKWFQVDVSMKNSNRIQNEIDKILNPPEEIPEEEEEDIIVLDDSSEESDDEIEILETVKTKETPVEPILEKIEDDEVQLIDIPLDDEAPNTLQSNTEKTPNTSNSKLVYDQTLNKIHFSTIVSSPAPTVKEDLQSEITEAKQLESQPRDESVKDNADCVTSSNSAPFAVKRELNKSASINSIEDTFQIKNDTDLLNDILNNKEIVKYKDEDEADALKDIINNKEIRCLKSPPPTLPTLSGEEIATLLQPAEKDPCCNFDSVNIEKTEFGATYPRLENNGDLLNNLMPNNAVENDADDSCSSEDILYYVQPKLTQCLECLDDQGTLSQLSSHMLTSGHLNISWAAQTNVISDNGVLRF